MPADLYVMAILISKDAPVAKLVIYAAVPVLYLIATFVGPFDDSPGSEEAEFA